MTVGRETRTEVMRELIKVNIDMNMTMNRMIANSFYFDSDTMNELATAINHIDKALYYLDLYEEKLRNAGLC